MSNDQYKEILSVIVAGSMLFIFLVTVIVMFMLYYQKKKFQYFEEKKNMQAMYERQLLEIRLEIQEEVFDAISREIHDNVGQLLSLVKVQLNILNRDQDINQELIKEIKANLGQVMNDLRHMARNLNSDYLLQLTLSEATRQVLQRVESVGIVTAKLVVIGEERSIGEQKKIIVFRMIQESIQNILKHAQAQTVRVHIRFEECTAEIIIEDDGVGFDTTLNVSKGLGLQNMTKRAMLTGGSVKFDSIIGRGTTIAITIPYE